MATGVISCHRSTVASEKSDATSESMPPGKLTVLIHTCSGTELWSTFYDLIKSYKLEQRSPRRVPSGTPETETDEAEPI